MITRTIDTIVITVAKYSYLDGAHCELEKQTYIGDEKKARKLTEKLYAGVPHEIISVEKESHKYAMGEAMFVEYGTCIDNNEEDTDIE